jgi:hypothetical protein
MADAEGMVRSTAPGIARRANLGLSDTEKALRMFEAPDNHSRSLNDEGKRIKRVDGGYQIINYGKYRERDYTAAERMRRLRAKRNVTRNGCNETVTLRKQKQSTEADKKKEGANKSRPPVCIEDWLKELESDPTYKGVDVRREYGKMLNWCKLRNKVPSQRRFVNWLNNTDPKLPAQHASKPDYKRSYAPPAREPTDEELAKARAIAKAETAKLREQLK